MSTDTNVRPKSLRSKRIRILSTAIDHFGRDGYECTKWASIADAVGIGQPALYHYFDSKSHCLLTIMRLELAESIRRFDTATAPFTDPVEAIRAAIAVSLDSSQTEALQRKIVQDHMELLAVERQPENEESERIKCNELAEGIKKRWTALIQLGANTGAFVDDDPELMARLTLGLVDSVWRWYRPDDRLTLDQVSNTTTNAVLRLVTPT